MIISQFNATEFDCLISNQHLVVASSATKHYKSIDAFTQSTSKISAFDAYSTHDNILQDTHLSSFNSSYFSGLLEHFIGISFSSEQRVTVLNNDWDVEDYVFEFGRRYYRYFWRSQA